MGKTSKMTFKRLKRLASLPEVNKISKTKSSEDSYLNELKSDDNVEITITKQKSDLSSNENIDLSNFNLLEEKNETQLRK